MKAKSKPIEEVAPAAAESRTATVAMEIPSAKRRQTILGSEDADIAEFVRLLHEEAKAF
jgi:electron transfer flavoprotein alpha/beta subunit